MMPVSERIDWSVSAVPRRSAVIATVVQLYVVAAYLVGGVLPYLWRHRAAPPEPVAAVGGLLFGAAGFWVTALGAAMAWIAVPAAGVWLAVRRHVSGSVNAWLIAATVVCVAYGGWALTPTANVIRGWLLD